MSNELDILTAEKIMGWKKVPRLTWLVKHGLDRPEYHMDDDSFSGRYAKDEVWVSPDLKHIYYDVDDSCGPDVDNWSPSWYLPHTQKLIKRFLENFPEHGLIVHYVGSTSTFIIKESLLRNGTGIHPFLRLYVRPYWRK